MRTLEQIQQDIIALSDADRAALAEWLVPVDHWRPSAEQLAEWNRRVAEYERTGEAIEGEDVISRLRQGLLDETAISA